MNMSSKTLEKMDDLIESFKRNPTTHALYAVSENAGIYYMVIAIIPLIFYYDLLLPEVNDAEEKYLKRFLKTEVQLVLCQPLVMLLGIIILFLGGWPPYSVVTHAVIVASMFYYSGFITLKYQENTEIRYELISKSVRGCSLAVVLSLFPFVCALTGLSTFNFLPSNYMYRFPSQGTLPPPNLKIVDKNGALAAVDMNRGYFTYILYVFAPEILFFVTMFYLSHLWYAAAGRCLMFYLHFSIDTLTKLYYWVISD